MPSSPRSDAANVLAEQDALDVATLVPAGGADLVYLDPPFKVERRFGARVGRSGERSRGPVAYDDTWPSLAAYLAWLEARIAAMRDVLAPHGTMWLHLDQRAVHEAKLACDRIFGRRAFRGEIIWMPGNGNKARGGPGTTHQTLLLYGGPDALWNGQDPALREPYAATSLSMHFTRTDDDGRRYRDRTVNGKTYRYYADEGRAIGSVWADCPSMSANTPLRRETTGYPTQKPEKLLDRIVRATSRPGALVVDPFCGSGTTLVTAARAGRRFVGSDIGALAVATTAARLDRAKIAYRAHVVAPPGKKRQVSASADPGTRGSSTSGCDPRATGRARSTAGSS